MMSLTYLPLFVIPYISSSKKKGLSLSVPCITGHHSQRHNHLSYNRPPLHDTITSQTHPLFVQRSTSPRHNFLVGPRRLSDVFYCGYKSSWTSCHFHPGTSHRLIVIRPAIGRSNNSAFSICH